MQRVTTLYTTYVYMLIRTHSMMGGMENSLEYETSQAKLSGCMRSTH